MDRERTIAARGGSPHSACWWGRVTLLLQNMSLHAFQGAHSKSFVRICVESESYCDARDVTDSTGGYHALSRECSVVKLSSVIKF